MAVSANLERLISVSAPFWAGEAEVVRTYWDSPVRSVQSDMDWLRRQCIKEFNGTGAGVDYKNLGILLGPAVQVQEQFDQIDRGLDRHDLLETLDIMRDEFSHYVLFADIYDHILPDNVPAIHPGQFEAWSEEDTFRATRHGQIAEHGAIGRRASQFTEGGYCTLYREGMALKGRAGTEDMIATACTQVYEDEFGHMLTGMVGIDDEGLNDEEFELLTRLVIEQLKQRIPGRNVQFNNPLSDERVAAIIAGDIEPLSFDYAEAERRIAAKTKAA
jgi:hypothetical protein